MVAVHDPAGARLVLELLGLGLHDETPDSSLNTTHGSWSACSLRPSGSCRLTATDCQAPAWLYRAGFNRKAFAPDAQIVAPFRRLPSEHFQPRGAFRFLSTYLLLLFAFAQP